MSNFDVWITEFRPDAESPDEGLQRVFGIDGTTARLIVGTVPRAVKHNVHAKTAGEIRAALESIGAVVECRPAQPVRSMSHLSEPVMEEEVAHFKSGPPTPVPGRMSAIDPYAIPSNPDAPRLSFDQVADATRRPTTRPPPPGPSGHPSIVESLRASAKLKGLEREMQAAIGGVGVGIVILIGALIRGNSIFQGTAGLIATCVQAAGLFLIGYGSFEAFKAWRAREES